jgi:hypothetical protein
MNVAKPIRPEEAQPLSMIDREIRDIIRRESVLAPKSPPPASNDSGEIGTDKLNVLIDKVSAHSVKEIDRLIAELKSVRDYLQAEGERVQREISSYAHVSQTAMASVRVIIDSMGQWKDTGVTAPSIVTERPGSPK